MLMIGEATAWWSAPKRVYRDRSGARSGRDAIGA
ncbi:hypothetical protein F4557_000624 [Actinomadura catellatispora]|uniref:Uncharacterized protein n=1 Tax=Actinomadura livida TaxID=79909 RepID=A0A7W7MV34_9ACTN|nr:hypothetical protein [Actinomadura catellatispora]